MKTLFAFVIVGVALNNSGFARIGETDAQLEKRYGSAITTGTLPRDRTLYKFKGFTTTVHFSPQRKSDVEEIWQGDKITMADGVIRGFLRANAPARTYWKLYRGMNSWKRSDGKAIAYVVAVEGSPFKPSKKAPSKNRSK